MQNDTQHLSQDSRQSIAEQIEDAYRRRAAQDEAEHKGTLSQRNRR